MNSGRRNEYQRYEDMSKTKAIGGKNSYRGWKENEEAAKKRREKYRREGENV